MDLINTLVEFFLHLDEQLAMIISQYGAWTYAILFLIIFCETGLVVTPFLPGDSLLFAAGMFAGLYPDALNIYFAPRCSTRNTAAARSCSAGSSPSSARSCRSSRGSAR